MPEEKKCDGWTKEREPGPAPIWDSAADRGAANEAICGYTLLKRRLESRSTRYESRLRGIYLKPESHQEGEMDDDRDFLGGVFEEGKLLKRIAALERELSEARSWKPELERLTRHALAQDRELDECRAKLAELAEDPPE